MKALVLLSAGLLVEPGIVVAQAAPTTQEEFAWLQGEVTHWAEAHGVFAGPTLIEDTAIQVLQTSTYLCFSPDARCVKFRDRTARHRVIEAYLNDLLANPTTMTGLMPRLFAAAGSSLKDIGWPDGPWFNRYVIVARPAALAPTLEAFYVHWRGSEGISANRSKLALPIGLHSFYVASASGTGTALVLRAARQGGSTVLLAVSQTPVDPHYGSEIPPSRIEPELDRYCMDKPVDPAEPMYRVPTGRARAPQSGVVPSDFHAADVIDVSLTGAPTACDAACQRWIGVEVIQALSQWRAGCAGCLPTTLSAVRIAGDLYVADRFVNWIQFVSEAPGAAPINNAYGIAERLTGGGGVNATMGFQRVGSTRVLSELCGASPAEDALSGKVRSQICAAAVAACTPASGCLGVPITLTGTPDCRGFLACGSPDHNVTVNTSEFQFATLPAGAAGASQLLIGTPSTVQHGVPVPLYPVLLHEVGHWFGLPHVESDVGPDGRDEVMKATGGTDKVCISRAALNMVSNAVDRNWQFRLRVQGGLRYAPD